MICAAKKTAHRSVMASPNSKERELVVSDTSPMPTMHIPAAPTLARVGRLAGDDPQHEGHDDAVGSREKGVLSRCSVSKPHGLHPEGEEGHGGQHESRLKARPVQRARQRAAEHGGHEQPRQEEAHADELGRRQHVHGVLHHHEGEPPNNGGRQQHELVHEARDMSLLSHSLPL